VPEGRIPAREGVRKERGTGGKATRKGGKTEGTGSARKVARKGGRKGGSRRFAEETVT